MLANQPSNLMIGYGYQKFNAEGLGEFDFNSSININFEVKSYSIEVAGEIKIVKEYGDTLSEEEISIIVKDEMKRHQHYIEEKLKEYSKQSK